MSLNFLFNLLNYDNHGLRYRRSDDIIDIDYEDLSDEEDYEED